MSGLNKLEMGLYEHLVNMLQAVPPEDRTNAYWVMSQEWHDELERIFGDKYSNPGFTFMFGQHIRINPDGQAPSFPELVVQQKLIPEQKNTITVPAHTHELDGREVANALEKYLRTVLH